MAKEMYHGVTAWIPTDDLVELRLIKNEKSEMVLTSTCEDTHYIVKATLQGKNRWFGEIHYGHIRKLAGKVSFARVDLRNLIVFFGDWKEENRDFVWCGRVDRNGTEGICGWSEKYPISKCVLTNDHELTYDTEYEGRHYFVKLVFSENDYKGIYEANDFGNIVKGKLGGAYARIGDEIFLYGKWTEETYDFLIASLLKKI